MHSPRESTAAAMMNLFFIFPPEPKGRERSAFVCPSRLKSFREAIRPYLKKPIHFTKTPGVWALTSGFLLLLYTPSLEKAHDQKCKRLSRKGRTVAAVYDRRGC